MKVESRRASNLGQVLVIRNERRVCVIVEVDHVVQAAEELLLRQPLCHEVRRIAVARHVFDGAIARLHMLL